ncbi:hypothetical protein [Pseudozobellia sp. WGM2]|uniref:hypothetical protein n=1 Tax=Pseudozobellia sp. WGM2 TaxID=2787625 RepID=UPI001AE024CA|nr:hypothetical protein [Pseudozobellia sp. WGM2]
MKASTQYNDFKGTVSADISDAFGGPKGDDIKSLARFFDLNFERFEPIGISLYGTDGFSVSLLCVDKERSTEEKEHIVSMSCEVEDEKEIIDILFKRLHIVLHNRFDDKYPNLDYDEEVNFSDFHETEEE